MTKSIIAFLLGLTVGLGAVAKAQALERISVETGFGPREVLLQRAAGGARPTILVLHGARGTGESAASHTGFAEAASRHGFTAVFPSGVERRWHYGSAVPGSDPDDVSFLQALIRQLIEQGVSDPTRIYIAGVSNGGLMTFAMACKAGELFAGVATIVANMPAELESCALRPARYVMINSTADQWMPYSGGAVGQYHAGGQVLSAEETAAFLERADGCASSATEALARRGASSGTSVTRKTWLQCKPGTSVTFYRVENGGHTVPGTSPPPGDFGPTNQDFSAADAIVSEFAHQR